MYKFVNLDSGDKEMQDYLFINFINFIWLSISNITLLVAVRNKIKTVSKSINKIKMQKSNLT